MKFLILLVCLLPLVIAQQCRTKVDYDVNQLTMTWPSTFCQTNQCKPSIKQGETKFTVHGMWPNRNDRQPVDNCCGDDYSKISKDFQSIRPKLTAVWPSMRDDRVDGFWRYEYNKHGKCAVGPLKGPDYFKNTLKVVEKLDLDNTMKKLDFAPSDNPDKTYDSRKLDAALTKHYGAKPKIRCIRVSQTLAILEQVSFCYDKELKMVDCQGNLQCAKNVIIPTYKANLSKYQLK